MDEKERQQRKAYREAARKQYEDAGQVESARIKIPDHANIHVGYEGAFVEAVIWIPKEAIEP